MAFLYGLFLILGVGFPIYAAEELFEVDFTKGAEVVIQKGGVFADVEFLNCGQYSGIINPNKGGIAGVSFLTSEQLSSTRGALEIEIVPLTDMSFYAGDIEVHSLTILQLLGKNQDRLSIGAVVAPGYQFCGVSLYSATEEVSRRFNTAEWKKGEVHRISVAWDKLNFSITVDNQKVSKYKFNKGFFTADRLIVCGYNNTIFIVKKLRLNAVPGNEGKSKL